MRRWTVLLAAIWFAACAGSPQTGTVERAKIDRLIVGQSTMAEVSSSCGPPFSASTLADGRQVMIYRTAWLETGPMAGAGGFGTMGSSSESHYGRATLTFDARGILQGVSSTRE